MIKEKNMKTTALISLGFASLIAAGTVFAFGENKLPDNSMSMTKVLGDLKSKGVSLVQEIEFDNGVYKAKVVNNEGKSYKITFNPQTGELKGADNLGGLSAMDVAEKIQGQGYTNIYEMDLNSDKKYEAKALNKDGKRTKLEIDAVSGRVLKEKSD